MSLLRFCHAVPSSCSSEEPAALFIGRATSLRNAVRGGVSAAGVEMFANPAMGVMSALPAGVESAEAREERSEWAAFGGW